MVVPFVYNNSQNLLNVANDRRDPSFATTNPILGIINSICNRCNEYSMQSGKVYINLE